VEKQEKGEFVGVVKGSYISAVEKTSVTRLKNREKEIDLI